MQLLSHFIVFGAFFTSIAALCYEPLPSFPVPLWSNRKHDLSKALTAIEEQLDRIISSVSYDSTSYSIQLTSNTQTLWSRHHTARKQNETRPGDQHVDENSLYRIASITKLFTTLGLLYQHDAGNVSLDDPISAYIPELSGELPWDDISLRILASQLSGIPRETAQEDIINYFPDPTVLGLPPVSREGLPTCDEYSNWERPCNWTDLIDMWDKFHPLFAPNQKSTYSNGAFELIGLALEKVTGMRYEDYIQKAIFDPLEMTSSTFVTPKDKHAVLPIGENAWDIVLAGQNPTGGIYSSASDLTKFVRFIMTHYNTLATGVNWLMPASFAEGINSFYGMPFEVFRSDSVLKESRRPVTFATKSGGLPGYCSLVTVMPEFGLGLTILVGGECDLVAEIVELVTVTIAQAAEDVIWRYVDKTYSGIYNSTDPSLESSLSLSTSPSTGLVINHFISNGTAVYENLLLNVLTKNSGPNLPPVRLQLVPTLLFKNESAQQGEIWKMTAAFERRPEGQRKVWDDFCTTDMDGASYAGKSITELVFWHEEGVVELPGWRVKLKRLGRESETPGLMVQ